MKNSYLNSNVKIIRDENHFSFTDTYTLDDLESIFNSPEYKKREEEIEAANMRSECLSRLPINLIL